jgi:hypothetical protein
MFELGGPAGYYSVNYSFTAVQMVSSAIEGRIGYSSYRIFGIDGKFCPDIIVPFGLEYRHTKFSRLSAGAGLTVSGIQRYLGNDLKMDWRIAGFESLTYSFVMKEHFSAKLSAYLLNEPQKPLRAWGGLALTYLF